MTIHPHHEPHLERLGQYMHAPMLMLGAQGSAIPGFPTAREYFAQWAGDDYHELDLDGGDLHLDLNKDLRVNGLEEVFRTVFNLGTIEHVWNAHNTWANALRAVEVGGHFLSHGPISGWVNHGLHMTNPDAIRAFISKNGFSIRAHWTSHWARPDGTFQGDVMWLAAVKERHIEELADFEPAWQVYEEGQKKAVR